MQPNVQLKLLASTSTYQTFVHVCSVRGIVDWVYVTYLLRMNCNSFMLVLCTPEESGVAVCKPCMIVIERATHCPAEVACLL